MKKRLLGLFLCVVMCISLLTVNPAKAAEAPAPVRYGINVGGVEVTSANMYDVFTDSGSVTYDVTQNKLTLNNATIKPDYSEEDKVCGIINNSGIGIYLNIIGNCTIDLSDVTGATNLYGFWNDANAGDLLIEGNGKLTIKVPKCAGSSYGIYNKGNVYFTGDTELNIVAGNTMETSGRGVGIYTGKNIQLVSFQSTKSHVKAEIFGSNAAVMGGADAIYKSGRSIKDGVFAMADGSEGNGVYRAANNPYAFYTRTMEGKWLLIAQNTYTEGLDNLYKYIKICPAVSGVKVTNSGADILSWDEFPGAAYYKVYTYVLQDVNEGTISSTEISRLSMYRFGEGTKVRFYYDENNGVENASVLYPNSEIWENRTGRDKYSFEDKTTATSINLSSLCTLWSDAYPDAKEILLGIAVCAYDSNNNMISCESGEVKYDAKYGKVSVGNIPISSTDNKPVADAKLCFYNRYATGEDEESEYNNGHDSVRQEINAVAGAKLIIKCKSNYDAYYINGVRNDDGFYVSAREEHEIPRRIWKNVTATGDNYAYYVFTATGTDMTVTPSLSRNDAKIFKLSLAYENGSSVFGKVKAPSTFRLGQEMEIEFLPEFGYEEIDYRSLYLDEACSQSASNYMRIDKISGKDNNKYIFKTYSSSNFSDLTEGTTLYLKVGFKPKEYNITLEGAKTNGTTATTSTYTAKFAYGTSRAHINYSYVPLSDDELKNLGYGENLVFDHWEGDTDCMGAIDTTAQDCFTGEPVTNQHYIGIKAMPAKDITIKAVYRIKDHQHTQDNIVCVPGKAATCTDGAGYKDCYRCSICGKYFEDEGCYVAITDYEAWKTGAGAIYPEHVWAAEYTIDVAPTCTEYGLKSIHCTNCSETKDTSIIDPTHAWEADYTIDVEPTCTTAGSKSIHCANCSEKKDVTSIDPVHTWDTTYTVDVQPTCTTAGSESIHCSKCDATKDARSIPVTEHAWKSEYTIDVQPTCTKAGSKSIHCANCEATKDAVAIEHTGHACAAEYSKDATQHWHICTVCGEKVDVANHVSAGAATATSPEVCAICGYVIKEATGETPSGGGSPVIVIGGGGSTTPTEGGTTTGGSTTPTEGGATTGGSTTPTEGGVRGRRD